MFLVRNCRPIFTTTFLQFDCQRYLHTLHTNAFVHLSITDAERFSNLEE